MRPVVTGPSSERAKHPRPAARGTAADALVNNAAHGTQPDESTASPLPAPGERIGQYELIRELGRGGMGAVYAARDTKLGRKVAIKLLNSNHHPELTARFILEAKATAACNHENIVVIHEVGEHAGNPFMVLEYLQGAPLSQLLQDGRRLPPAQAIELIVPVVRALTVAHTHNIVHRDLKPDNIFVTDSGTVKVLDFGIAKLVHQEDDDGAALLRTAATTAGPGGREMTRRGTLVGTLPYMSPEQWGAGGATVDHQSDLWAVGIILFEMVAGQHPLAPRKGWDLMVTGVLREPMPSVRTVCPSLSDELASIIDHCLVKRRDHRFGSARELLDALEPLLPGRYVRRLRSDESPYAGLRSFQESDAHRFFGRSRDVAAAVARLRDLPLIGVVGPSGVGKSSFVRAGIVPALKASGEPWSTLVVRPGRSPMAALAYALAPMLSTSSGGSTTEVTVAADLSQQQRVVERLYAEPGYLGAALRSRARNRDQHILLFIDQFEELYTQVVDPRERLAFTACLAGVCDDVTTPLRLVLALRSDFLDHLAEAPTLLAELTHGLFFLTPPTRDGLRDALIQPAEMAGYQFEAPSMVESMLDHLEHTPGALPLLQFAASQLWETRDRDRRMLTVESYHRIGGIAGALAGHADAVVAECTQREQILVRALFLRLVTPERTRAIIPVNELHELSADAGEIHRIVDRLIRSRLLVGQTVASAGGTSAGGTVELVHESLIHGWLPGPVLDSATCNNDCTLARCGDGHTNRLFKVTDDGPDHVEECDSGMLGVRRDSAICNSNCTIPQCGDGRINAAFVPPGATTGEVCDDGDQNSDTEPDACRKNCHRPFCGDGVKDTSEQCDNGNDPSHDLDNDGKINSNTMPDACRTNCHTASCGDGVKDTGEQCDRGTADTARMGSTPACIGVGAVR